MPSPATLNPGDFIFVTLLSNRPGHQKLNNGWEETEPDKEKSSMTIGWNGRMTELKPGRKTMVILEAATNAFGDPRSAATAQAIPMGDPATGERLFIPDRTSEVRRLRLRYGIHDGNDGTFENINGTFMAPRVKMETENGDEIVSVLDDPEGKTVNQVATTIQEQSNSNALIEHLTKQVEALTRLVESNQSANPSPSLDELPSDVDSDPDPDSTSDFTPSSNSDTFDELPDDD